MSKYFPFIYAAILAVVLAMVALLSYRVGVNIERGAWQAKELKRQAAETQAVADRLADNERIRKQHEEDTRRVSDEYDRHIGALKAQYAADRAAAAAAGGLRIPRAVCDSAPATAETDRASVSDGAAAGTVRLPEPIESDLWRFAEDADRILEQARACQAWIAAQGFTPEGAP